MSNEKQESLADIVADMRQGMNPNGTAECQYLESDICTLADRLEAAHKREMSKIASKNRADFGQLGDCAKLREAVKLAMSVLCRNEADAPYRAWCEYDNAIDKCKAALAAPPRNCDVGSAEEQDQRFRDFCPKYTHGGSTSDCEGCKASGTACFECALVWEQMPYEEGGSL